VYGIWYYTINIGMDENTVFSNGTPPTNSNTTPVQPPVSPAAPVSSPPPMPIQTSPSLQPQPISSPPQMPFSQVSPPGASPSGIPPISQPLEEESGFPFGKILKVLGGLIILIVLFFLVTKLILPRFQNTSSSQATLTYWGLWENEGAIKGIIADFERENPTIKIKYEKQDIKQYRERLNARIQNGTGPDIFRYHNSWYPMFSSILAPLTKDVMSKDDFNKNYYPVIQQDSVKNGAIYGVPLGIDVLAMYVNKDIFAASGLEVPTTWDSFASTARKLTVKDESGKIKTSGAALGTFDNINHAPDIISLLLVQNGADLKDLESTAQNTSDALSFYTSFANDNGNVWDETLDPSLLMFIKGNLAMYFGYSWDIFAIRDSNPDLPFEIYPVPHLPDRSMTIASYWIEGVSAKSKQQKEAMMFMKFLAKKETQQKLFTETSKTRLFGEPYSRVDLAESLRDNQYVYPFISQAKNAVSSFFAADTYDNGLNSQMNVYLGNAIRSMLNGDSAQTAVETLSLGVSQVISQYGQ